MNKSLKPNEPNVISEPMEGELVVINLETGCYYSLNSSAAVIWQHLEKGVKPINIAKNMYLDGPSEDITFKIETFCKYLQEEKLMIESSFDADLETRLIEKISFKKPVIDKFEDMQEMLLLDPIHEVNDQGWPHELK